MHQDLGLVTRSKDKKQDERERMTAAMRRLEELLADPGPNITVTPVGERDHNRFQRAADSAPRYDLPSPSEAEKPEPAEPAAFPPAPAAVEPAVQPLQRRPAEPAQPSAGSPIRRTPRILSEQPAQVTAAGSTPAPQSAPAPARAAQPSAARTEPSAKATPAPDAPAAGVRHEAEMPNTPDWVRSLSASPKTPPPRAAPEAKPAKGHGGLASTMKNFSPERSSAGLFGLCLRWFLGPKDSEVKNAVRASRRALNATFVFSAFINILMLAGPLFMLQVYDRVLTSGSIPTLVALFVITAGLYGIIGVLELARSRIIGRIGAEIDQRLCDRIFEASLRKSLATQGAAAPALRELDSFRQFISGPAPITFFDAPWTPVYLGVIFMTHWTLGVAATIGTVILLGLAWTSEQSRPRAACTSAACRDAQPRNGRNRPAQRRSHHRHGHAVVLSQALAGAQRRRPRLAAARGRPARRPVGHHQDDAPAAAIADAGDRRGPRRRRARSRRARSSPPPSSSAVRWPPSNRSSVTGEGFVKARESYRKLEDILSYAPPERARTQLPRPEGILEVQDMRVAAPETRNVILTGHQLRGRPRPDARRDRAQRLGQVDARARPRRSVADVRRQPSCSTARVSTSGIRKISAGTSAICRRASNCSPAPCSQNIARFRDDATDDEVIEAAKQAHAHELILALPHGYETELGTFGSYLSGGQRQRIALARALFGNPPLVVLDEPNSNLDRPGDEALSAAIDGMRRRGQTIILVSHRVQAIGKADLLLFIERGQQRAFGPRNEVMKLFQPRNDRAPAEERRTPSRPADDAVRAQRPTGSAG